MISKNCSVEKAKWEYLGYNTLLIEKTTESHLFKQGFFDDNILALKIDSTNDYVFLVNKMVFEKEINSVSGIIELLDRHYLNLNKNALLKDHETNTVFFAPNHEITSESELFSFMGNKTIQQNLLFADGSQGQIFNIIKSNEFYFLGKTEGFWVNLKFFYEDKHSCINALHHFLHFQKELKNGFIMMS